MSLTDRFIRYVKISTQADPNSDSLPSTAGQHDLAALLGKELGRTGPDGRPGRRPCLCYSPLAGK